MARREGRPMGGGVIPMPWFAPIIGYVDNLGILKCAEHAAEDKRQHPVSGEGYFGPDDVCEQCGKQFEHVKSDKYEHRAFA